MQATTATELISVWANAESAHGWHDSFRLPLYDFGNDHEILLTPSEVTDDGYLAGLYDYYDDRNGFCSVWYVELSCDEIGSYVELVVSQDSFKDAVNAITALYGNRVTYETI